MFNNFFSLKINGGVLENKIVRKNILEIKGRNSVDINLFDKIYRKLVNEMKRE